jgi:hypothetical protein
MNKKKPWTGAHGLYGSLMDNDDQQSADTPAA